MKKDKYKCCGCNNIIEIPKGSSKPYCRKCDLTMDIVNRRNK